MEETAQVRIARQRTKLASEEEILMKGMLNVQIEKKSPKAWANVKRLGKILSKKWKLKEPSWELISASRR